MDNDLVFIIQARLGSSRLPNKIILPFYQEKNILELMLDKLSLFFLDIPVIIATTCEKKDDVIEQIGKKKNILVFRGNENDVLGRFINAAEFFNKKHIIRICSDNPFLSVFYLKELLSFIKSNRTQEYDYISFKVNGKPSIRTHYGLWTEYVSLSALKKVSELTDLSFYHEHVTNFIYEHPDKFSIKLIPVLADIETHSYLRLTIDTPTDFELLSNIYSAISDKKADSSIIDFNDVLTYITSNTDSNIILEMTREIQNNTK